MNIKEAIKLAVVMHTHSTKLQAEVIAQDMSYEKMVEKARAIELTKKEVQNIKNKEDSFQVDYIGGARQGRSGRYPGRERSSSRPNFEADSKGNPSNRANEGRRECYNCGFRGGVHECRAKQAVCYKCQSKGHYARMCMSKRKDIQMVGKDEGDSDWRSEETDYQLNQIEIDMVKESKEKSRKYPSTQANFQIGGVKVFMKVDSGADANIIGTDIFEMIQQKQVKPILLRKTKARLTGLNLKDHSKSKRGRGSFNICFNICFNISVKIAMNQNTTLKLQKCWLINLNFNL